jgi:starch-binding outer membrane protein, SusD/RagB family
MKMKQSRILYICMGLMLLLVTSCKKELTKVPYNAVAEEDAFQSQTDFENAVRGIYRRIGFEQGYYGGDMIIVPDLLADNLITSTSGRGTFVSTSRWLYNGDNTVDLFTTGYSIIRAANGVLKNIDNGVLTGEVKDNFMGEALAIRGLVHFDIARMYAKTPLMDINPAVDLGIPYVTDIDINATPAREAIADNYAKIVQDLSEALSLISESDDAVANGRLNKVAVAGLLSKVYLYMGEWQNAADAATTSLDMNSDVGSLSALQGIFNDSTNAGVLFKTRILDVDDIALGVNYSQTSPSSGVKSEFVATYDLYQMYNDNDVRKTAYIQVSPYLGVNQYHVKKYFGRLTGNLNVVDAKILRVADVLLIRAEAYARLNRLAEALADLNKLKENRYVNYVPFVAGSQADVLNEIWKERRLELAFEGDRFFDLKRRNLGIERNANYGDKADGSGTKFPAFALSLPAGSEKLQLPFPQTEIDVNPNFVQNPGY